MSDLFKTLGDALAPIPQDVNTSRVGTFSSSSIWKLLSKDKTGKGMGAPGKTYINEKRMERRLGRSLNSEVIAKSTSWGNLLEKMVFDILPLDYILESKTRFVHPTIAEWTGAPDLVQASKVGDIKCPFTMKAFVELVDSLKSVQTFKEHSPDYYWQLVSNSILTNRKKAEIVVYCPYKKDLAKIRELERSQPEHWEACQVTWMKWTSDEGLPYLIEGMHYKPVNIFEFDVPGEDRTLLTKTVMEAVKLLKA